MQRPVRRGSTQVSPLRWSGAAGQSTTLVWIAGLACAAAYEISEADAILLIGKWVMPVARCVASGRVELIVDPPNGRQ